MSIKTHQDSSKSHVDGSDGMLLRFHRLHDTVRETS